jgi:hypothetical protein
VGIYVLDSTEDNRIYGNRIGYNDRNIEGYNSTVHWDDGVQIGNAWDDYSGEGDYNIPGEGEEVDHYPSQFVDDFMGPEITVIDVPDSIIDVFFYPIHLAFIVNVTDFSGIDDVRLYYRMAFSVASVNSHTDFVSVEMNPEQENSTNARYSYSFEITQGYDSFQYTIMSNDSHGIDSMSLDTYLLGVNDRIILRNKTGEVLILSSVSIAISSIIIAAAIYKRKTNASIIQAP